MEPVLVCVMIRISLLLASCGWGGTYTLLEIVIFSAFKKNKKSLSVASDLVCSKLWIWGKAYTLLEMVIFSVF